MLYQRAPRNIHRHVILSEVKEAVAALPSVRGVWNCVPVRVQLPTGRLVCHVGWSCCRGSVPVASFSGPSSPCHCLGELFQHGVMLSVIETYVFLTEPCSRSCNACPCSRTLALLSQIPVFALWGVAKLDQLGNQQLSGTQWLSSLDWSAVRTVIGNMSTDSTTCVKCPLPYVPLMGQKVTCSP